MQNTTWKEKNAEVIEMSATLGRTHAVGDITTKDAAQTVR
jgi:hypothetical protein